MDIVATTTALACFNTKRIKYRLITININNFWSYFTFLLVTEMHVSGVTVKQFTFDKIVNPVKNVFLINLNILLYYVILFH